MAYNTPYKFLNRDEVSYLLNRDNQVSRVMYIDCLALLHDLLAAYSSIPDNPVFEASVVRRDTRLSIKKLPPQADSLKNNLQENLNSAVDLYDELNSTARTIPSFVTRSYADKFLNDLLEQYRLLRYSRVP